MTADEELLQVVEQHELAYTRAEVDAAEEAFRAFQACHPDYPINPELFHGWYYTLDALKEREAAARDMGLSTTEIEERDALLKSVRWIGPGEIGRASCRERV